MHDSISNSPAGASRAWVRYAGAAFVVALALIFSAGAGWAGSAKIVPGSGVHSGGQLHSKSRGHHVRKHQFRQHFGVRKRGRKHSRRRHHRQHSRHQGAGQFQKYASNCRHVSKEGYDTYGRWALIGSTLCYDAYGRSYIVDGSHYVIRYY